MTDREIALLVRSVGSLTVELSSLVLAVDWADSAQVIVADRWMKVLSSYGKNIEKCIAMTQKIDTEKTPGTDKADEMRDELYRRLARYADRVGPEELARRLAARGVEVGPLRLDVLGASGSTPPDDA